MSQHPPAFFLSARPPTSNASPHKLTVDLPPPLPARSSCDLVEVNVDLAGPRASSPARPDRRLLRPWVAKPVAKSPPSKTHHIIRPDPKNRERLDQLREHLIGLDIPDCGCVVDPVLCQCPERRETGRCPKHPPWYPPCECIKRSAHELTMQQWTAMQQTAAENDYIDRKPCKPTKAIPGSPEKLREIEERKDRKESLFHRGDVFLSNGVLIDPESIAGHRPKNGAYTLERRVSLDEENFRCPPPSQGSFALDEWDRRFLERVRSRGRKSAKGVA